VRRVRKGGTGMIREQVFWVFFPTLHVMERVEGRSGCLVGAQ
jgi:hypothetical protein